jgi:hypothetical protein
MADNQRDRRRRVLNLRQSMRQAAKATSRALEELPPSFRSQAGTATRPILQRTMEFAALATQPNITFGVTEEGKLISQDVRGTARHEVAHHLGASPTREAGHLAFRGVTGSVTGGLSRQQVPQVVGLQEESFERRVQRAVRATNRSRSRSKGISQIGAPVQRSGRPRR